MEERSVELSIAAEKESGLGTAGFVLGIIACSCNVLFFTSFFGLICGILALIFGAVAYRSKKGRAGLILSLFSFLVLLIWVASFLIIYVEYPFL